MFPNILFPMTPQMPAATNYPMRSNRIPARVEFAMQFVKHVNDTITDPQYAQFSTGEDDEPEAGEMMVRKMSPTEKAAYDQALRTISQWLAQENDFSDDRSASWTTNQPEANGVYIFVPQNADTLSGGLVAVRDIGGVTHMTTITSNGQPANIPVDKNLEGSWYGPMEVPTSTNPFVSDSGKAETSQHYQP